MRQSALNNGDIRNSFSIASFGAGFVEIGRNNSHEQTHNTDHHYKFDQCKSSVFLYHEKALFIGIVAHKYLSKRKTIHTCNEKHPPERVFFKKINYLQSPFEAEVVA